MRGVRLMNQNLLKRCKLRLREVAPKTIPDSEVNAFVDKIAELKEREAKRGDKGNFRKAVKEFLDQHRMALSNQRQEKLMNLVTNERRAQYYLQFDPSAENGGGKKYTGKIRGQRMVEAVMSKMGGGQQLIPSINDSVSAKSSVRYRDYQAFAYSNLAKKGLWEVFESGALEREIMMEMHELRPGGQPGISKSKEAKEIAEVLNGLHRRQMQDLKGTGLNIGEVVNYIMKQSHDRIRVKEAGLEQWKRTIAPLLDSEKTFGLEAGNNKKMNEFLDAAYDHIVNGKFELPDDIIQSSDELITTANYSKLGNQITKSRQLHFKDGNSFFEYNKAFGVADLKQALHRQMRNTAKNSSLIEAFGTNPDAAFQADKVKIRAMLKGDDEALKAFNNGMEAMDNLFKQVRGTNSMPMNENLAKASSIVRSLNNLQALGGTTLRSLPDVMTGIAITSSQTGQGMFHTTGTYAKAFMDSVVPSQRKQTAELINAFIKDHFGEVAHVTGADGMDRVPGIVAQSSNLFFKMIGLEYWTETTRMAPALLLAREGAIHAPTKWTDLPNQYRANLQRYGIDAGDWSRIGKAVDQLPDGTMAVIPDKVGDRGTYLKWSNYIQENADFSAPNPNDRVRARIIRGTQAGTLSGEVHRFIGQFKAFPLFGYDIGLRILASNPDKPLFYYRDALKGQGDFQRMIGYMVGATALAYAGDSMLSIAKNETPGTPDNPETIRRAFQLSGVAGLYGDVLLGEAQRLQQGGLWNQLLGPTASKISDVTALSSGFMSHKIDGKDTSKDARKAFDLLVRQVPGNNIFYIKTAMDQAILDRIRGSIDPDYEDEKRARLEKRGKSQLIEF